MSRRGHREAVAALSLAPFITGRGMARSQEAYGHGDRFAIICHSHAATRRSRTSQSKRCRRARTTFFGEAPERLAEFPPFSHATPQVTLGMYPRASEAADPKAADASGEEFGLLDERPKRCSQVGGSEAN